MPGTSFLEKVSEFVGFCRVLGRWDVVRLAWAVSPKALTGWLPHPFFRQDQHIPADFGMFWQGGNPGSWTWYSVVKVRGLVVGAWWLWFVRVGVSVVDLVIS